MCGAGLGVPGSATILRSEGVSCLSALTLWSFGGIKLPSLPPTVAVVWLLALGRCPRQWSEALHCSLALRP